MACNRQNVTQCQRCTDLIIQNSPNSKGSCTLNSNSLYDPNCIHMQLGNTMGSVCEMCVDGFYQNPYYYCSQCRQQGCLTCDSAYDCQLCVEGFSPAKDSDSNIVKCMDCNDRSEAEESRFGLNYYKDCSSCNVNNNGLIKECLSCSSGFIYTDLKTKVSSCVTQCPTGYYGSTIYGPRGHKMITECLRCEQNCEQCIGGGAHQCKSCKKGQYLEFLQTSLSYGFCRTKLVKQAQYQIWVAPTPDIFVASPFDTGLGSRLFYDIREALRKANENCANVSNICNVTINLLNGEHYLFRQQRKDSFIPNAIERESQVMNLTFKPWYCDEAQSRNRSQMPDFWLDTKCVPYRTNQILIHNKMRDQFHFIVGQGLTIIGVNFDSLASVILPHYNDTDCLNSKKRCCNITRDQYGSVLVNASSQDCLRNDKQASEDCSTAPSTFSFIRFDISSKSVFNGTKVPPTLSLINSTFQNFLFQFNSFIELNSFGGNIIIQNTTFSRFSSCGALIKNVDPAILQPNLDGSQLQFQNTAEVYNYRNNKYSIQMQAENYAKKNSSQILSNPYLCNFATNCFQIRIEKSQFREFNFFMRQINQPALTKDIINAYQGKIISLNGFRGNISILDSQFSQNQLGYAGCQVMDGIENKVSVTNRLQIKNLISIRNHSNQVIIANNTFDSNSAVKGVLYIEQVNSSTSVQPQVLLFNNTFDSNFAYIDTSAVFIRSLPCSSVSLQQNLFTNNYGCTKYGGSALAIECLKSGTSAINGLDQLSQQSSQTQLSSLNGRTPTGKSSMVTIDTKRSVSVQGNRIEISGNTYIRNFAGYGSGLVDLNGVQKIEMINETFIRNGENTVENIAQMSENRQRSVFSNLINSQLNYNLSFYSLLTDFSRQAQSSIITIQEPQFQLKGMLRVKNSNNLYIEGLQFQENWLFESSFNHRQRALMLYLADFNGSLTLNSSTIQNNSGMFNREVRDRLLTNNVIQNALKLLDDGGIGQLNAFVAFDDKTCNMQEVNIIDTNFKKLNLRQLGQTNAQILIFQMNNSAQYFKALKSVVISNVTLQDIECIECNENVSLFGTTSDQVSIRNLKVKNLKKNSQMNISILNSYSLFKIDLLVPNQNITLISDSQIEDLIDVGSVIDLYVKQTRVNITMTSLSVNKIQSTQNQRGTSLVNVRQSTDSRIIITNSTFQNLNTLNSDGAVLSLRGDQSPLINLDSVLFKDCIFKSIQQSNQLLAQKQYLTRGLIAYVSQYRPIKVQLTSSNIACQSIMNSDFFNPSNLSVMGQANTADTNTGDDYGSLFHIKSSQVQLQSISNDIRNCAQSSKGTIFNIQAYLVGEYQDFQSNFTQIYGQMGGIIYCKNCYSLIFSPNQIKKIAAQRGATLALDSDTFCNQRGIQSYNLTSFKMDEVYSIYDGGALLYSRTDCFILLNIANIGVVNARSNLLVEPPINSLKVIHPMGQQNGQIDSSIQQDIEGGGLIKITASSVTFKIEKSILRNITSQQGSGGVINFNVKELLGTMNNVNVSNIGSKYYGTFGHFKGQELTFKLSQNSLVCRDIASSKLKVQFLSDLLDQEISTQTQAFHFNSTNPYSYSNVVGNLNNISNCYYDGADLMGSGGGVYYLSNSISMRDTKSQYFHNAAPYGSIYVCDGCNFNGNSNIYQSNVCMKGCILYYKPDLDKLPGMQIANQIQIQQSKFQENFAKVSASGIYLVSQPLPQPVIQGRSLQSKNYRTVVLSISKSNFTNNSADQGRGGIIYLNSINLQADIIQSNFTRNRLNGKNQSIGGQDSACIFLDSNQIKRLTISQSTFISDGSVRNASSSSSFSQNSPQDYQAVLFSRAQGTGLIQVQDSSFTQDNIVDNSVQDLPSRLKKYSNNQIYTIQNQGGVIYITGARNVSFARNQFRNNLYMQRGALYIQNTSLFSDSASIYQNNAGYEGSAFYIERSQARLQSIKLIGNYGDNGGTIFTTEGSLVNITKSQFTRNYARTSGGAISLQQTAQRPPLLLGAPPGSSSVPKTHINITSTNFEGNTALEDGGVLAVKFDNQSAQAQVEFSDCKFLGSSAGENGGILSSQNLKSLKIKRSTIKGVSSKQGKVMRFISQTNTSMELSQNQFICNDDYSYEYLVSATQYNMSRDGSAFQIDSKGQIISDSNDYNNCFDAQSGGVFNIAQIELIDKNSKFTNNSALEGGAIKCAAGCTLNFESTQFKMNLAAQGGALQLEQNSTLKGSNMRMLENEALLVGGAINILRNAQVNVSKVQFINNQADQASVVNLMGSFSPQNIIFQSTLFFRNRATKNTIQIMNSGGGIEINRCFFQFNDAKQFSKNIYIGQTKSVTIKNTSFYDFGDFGTNSPREGSSILIKNQSNMNQPNPGQLGSASNIIGQGNEDLIEAAQQGYQVGTFIYLTKDVNLMIQDSEFINGTAYQGGAIYIQGDSNVTLRGVSFKMNKAISAGGAIYANQFSILNVLKNSYFENNFAISGKGGDIFASSTKGIQGDQTTQSEINIEQSSIFNAQNSVNSLQLSGLKFTASNLLVERSSSTNKVHDGGSIFCQACLQFKLKNSNFKNSQGKSGGAIFLKTEPTEQNEESEITNTTFFNCKASVKDGGALAISGTGNLTLKNNKFNSNTANHNGGAVFSSCSSDACFLIIDELNMFLDNSAGISGGAIQWLRKAPLFPLNPVQTNPMFKNNKAGTYGPNIAGQVSSLDILSDTQYFKLLNKTISSNRILSSQDSIHQSSTLPVIRLAGVDHYGQVVLTENSLPIKIKAVIDQSNMNEIQVLSQSQYYLPKNGVYEIKDIKVANAHIGHQYSLRFDIGKNNDKVTDGILKQVQLDNKDTTLSQNQVDVIFGLTDPSTFQILTGNSTHQSCLESFKMPDCLSCEPGYHSIDCHKCPNHIKNIAVICLISLCFLVLLTLTLKYPKSLLNLYNHTVLIISLGIFNGFKGELYSVQCLVQSFESIYKYLDVLEILGVMIGAPFLIILIQKILGKSTLQDKLIAGYLIQPVALLYALQSLNCRQIHDDTYRLESNMSQHCFTGIHLYEIMFLTAPLLGLYGIGLPIYCLIANRNPQLLFNSLVLTLATYRKSNALMDPALFTITIVIAQSKIGAETLALCLQALTASLASKIQEQEKTSQKSFTVSIYVIMLSMNLIYYLWELYQLIKKKLTTVKLGPKTESQPKQNQLEDSNSKDIMGEEQRSRNFEDDSQSSPPKRKNSINLMKVVKLEDSSRTPVTNMIKQEEIQEDTRNSYRQQLSDSDRYNFNSQRRFIKDASHQEQQSQNNSSRTSRSSRMQMMIEMSDLTRGNNQAPSNLL